MLFMMRSETSHTVLSEAAATGGSGGMDATARLAAVVRDEHDFACIAGSIQCSIERSIEYSIERSIEYSIERFIEWSIEWSIGGSIECSFTGSIECCIECSIKCSIGRSIAVTMLDEEDVLDVRLLFSPKHARPLRAEVLAVKEGLARWCAARGSAAALAPSEWAIFQRPFGYFGDTYLFF